MTDEGDLSAPVALVTGAGRGIGRAVAHRLARDGATIAVNDRDAHVANAVAQEIVECGGQARACPTSVLDFEAVRKMVADLIAELGHVDILVSNAGVASSGRSVLRTPIDEVEDMARLNANAAFVLCQAVLPSMRARGWGRIVMISSTAVAEAPPKAAPYTMAKAALEALAYTLANEEALHGVRVNVVAPGMVDTRLARAVQARTATPIVEGPTQSSASTRPLISAASVADAVGYYVSEQADDINGQRLTVGSSTGRHHADS